MLQSRWLTQTLNIALCLLAFVIPMPFAFSALAVIIICVVWLLQVNIKLTFQQLVTRKALWPWIIFFLLHAISYTYSQNKAQSLFDLQEKLSIIILPIVIGAGMAIDQSLFERILQWFVAGVTAIALFCIARSFLIFQQTGQTAQFFYHALVHGLDANAVYQSWYTIFSLSGLLFYPWKNNHKLLRAAIILIQTVFLVLLSSKTLLAVFLLLILPYYIVNTAKGRASYIRAAGIAVLAAICVIALYKTENPIKKRYEDVIKQPITISDPSQPFNGSYNNLTVRLFIWQTGFQNIKEHNLWWKGAGNGDVQDLQNAGYAARGMKDIYNVQFPSPLRNANLHNMYLEVLIMLGIPGLLCLCVILFEPFFLLKEHNIKYFYFLFVFISCAFMLQEAAFQTQAGTIFYSFWAILLLNRYYTVKKLSIRS